MKKIIILKYGELSTKKENINFFIKNLKNNIEFILHDIDHETYYDKGRMFIIPSNNLEIITEKLTKVFGIHKIVIGYKLDTNDLEDIKKASIDILKDYEFKTFKVESRRNDKTYPLLSPEISKNIGE